MYRTRTRTRAARPAGAAGAEKPEADAEAARAADALRRAGGALPVGRLHAALESASLEPLARCLRRRSDLFLVVERPAGPWLDPTWTPAERAEYERGSPAAAEQGVILVDADASARPGAAPALLRESLIALWDEDRGDDQVRRELGRWIAR